MSSSSASPSSSTSSSSSSPSLFIHSPCSFWFHFHFDRRPCVHCFSQYIRFDENGGRERSTKVYVSVWQSCESSKRRRFELHFGRLHPIYTPLAPVTHTHTSTSRQQQQLNRSNKCLYEQHCIIIIASTSIYFMCDWRLRLDCR